MGRPYKNMGYDCDKYRRRSIRMAGYDYGSPGAYFVTVCAQGGKCILGEVVDGEMRSNEVGKMIEEVWKELPERYGNIDVDAFVVMPNHIHGIIILNPVGAGPRACPGRGQPGAVAPTAGTEEVGEIIRGRPRWVAPTLALGDVVHRLKSLTTARYRRGVVERGWVPFPGRLWQRNYWERVVRDEGELNATRQYIAENPLKWAFDRENPNRVDDGSYKREWEWLEGDVGGSEQ